MCTAYVFGKRSYLGSVSVISAPSWRPQIAQVTLVVELVLELELELELQLELVPPLQLLQVQLPVQQRLEPCRHSPSPHPAAQQRPVTST